MDFVNLTRQKVYIAMKMSNIKGCFYSVGPLSLKDLYKLIIKSFAVNVIILKHVMAINRQKNEKSSFVTHV